MDSRKIGYEMIKDDVRYSYDEYMDIECFTVCEATGKIIEESCRIVNQSAFTRASYFLNIAIESIKMGEIDSFIYEKIDKYVLESFEGIPEEEEALYKQDLDILKQLLKNGSFMVKEPGSGRARMNYLLTVK